MSQPPSVFNEAYTAILASKPRQVGAGMHFKDPWLMQPVNNRADTIKLYNSAGTLVTLQTTAGFTGIAQYGIQDQTDWTAGTYKTVYSHTGKGLVFGMIACEAGGAETSTFEITIDGLPLQEITITNANNYRAVLLAGGYGNTGGTEFTTATDWQKPIGSLDSATLTTWSPAATVVVIPTVMWYGNLGVPALRYDVSCLIRMKHSTSITNSTATAYSGVLVRKGITA